MPQGMYYAMAIHIYTVTAIAVEISDLYLYNLIINNAHVCSKFSPLFHALPAKRKLISGSPFDLLLLFSSCFSLPSIHTVYSFRSSKSV